MSTHSAGGTCLFYDKTKTPVRHDVNAGQSAKSLTHLPLQTCFIRTGMAWPENDQNRNPGEIHESISKRLVEQAHL